MRQYIISVCFAMLFCIAINILTPQKKYAGIIKIVCGVFVISAILNPLEDILFSKQNIMNFELSNFGEDEFFDLSEKSRQSFDSAMKSKYSEDIEKTLSKELSDMVSDDVSVTLKNSFGDTVACVICKDISHHSAIKEYIENSYNIKVEFAQ